MAVEPLNPRTDEKKLLEEGRRNLETYMKTRLRMVRKNNRAVAINTAMMIATVLGMGLFYHLGHMTMFALGIPVLALYLLFCYAHSTVMLMCEHLDRTIDIITAINFVTTKEKEEKADEQEKDDLPGHRA